jgi:hypothetical protein
LMSSEHPLNISIWLFTLWVKATYVTTSSDRLIYTLLCMFNYVRACTAKYFLLLQKKVSRLY